MKYLCMFVAFKIKTNKSEKGEIRKNLTIMKTGKMSSGNSVTPIVNPWQKMPITTKSGIT